MQRGPSLSNYRFQSTPAFEIQVGHRVDHSGLLTREAATIVILASRSSGRLIHPPEKETPIKYASCTLLSLSFGKRPYCFLVPVEERAVDTLFCFPPHRRRVFQLFVHPKIIAFILKPDRSDPFPVFTRRYAPHAGCVVFSGLIACQYKRICAVDEPLL